MDVLVKSFRVRRDGKRYNVGDIIRNLSEEEAQKLANESNGSITILQEERLSDRIEIQEIEPVSEAIDIPVVEPEENITEQKSDEIIEEAKDVEAVQGTELTEEVTELPTVEPEGTVSNKKGKDKNAKSK